MKRISIILMCCMVLASNFAFAQNKNIEKKVVFITLGDMDYVADDSLYGRQVINVPEITQSVMDNGGVLAFIERPPTDENPQRWSQLPQLYLSQDNPTFTYLSHGLGLVRLSYQSSKSIKDFIDFTRGKRLKLVIFY